MKKTNTTKALFKVCYFLKRYPRLSETFVVNEMQELQRQGIEIVIVARKSAEEKVVHEKTLALNVPIYYMPSVKEIPYDLWSVKSFFGLSGKSNSIGSNTLKGELSKDEYRTLVESAMIAPFIKSLGIDLIHAHFASWAATAASFTSRMTGIPYSFTAHAKDIYHESVSKKGLAEKIMRARFVITVSDFNKRYLEACLKSEGKHGNIERLYNGIDLDYFRPDGKGREPNLIVGVGRLVQKKGFRYLIEACNALNQKGRSFHCLIVGEGEERAVLEGMITQFSLKEKVVLLGAKPQSEVVKILKRATLFVLPCIIGDDGNRDGLPTVILESMAVGTPIISTNVTGIPEMIHHNQSGLVVSEKNSEELSKAIEVTLDSPDLREKFSKYSLAKVAKDFDVVKNVTSLKELFLSGKTPNRLTSGALK